jgi:hypothetical protein
MYRFLMFFLLLNTFVSCSKNDDGSSTPSVIIPDVINGVVTEFNLTPIDINTPDKGTFFIYANNSIYKVDFNAVDESASNATLIFGSDTILTDQSREFANLGKDAIAYNPVAENEILILFADGRKIDGVFDSYTSFGGVFGEDLISQWRDPNDPGKPTQKAKDDIINLVQRYADKDGPGPGTAPPYLFVKVSKS